MDSLTKQNQEAGVDVGAAIFAGALICLAIYGGYKLFKEEEKQTPALGDRLTPELIDQLLAQDLNV